MHKLSNWDFEKWKFWSKIKFLESEIYETENFWKWKIFKGNFETEILKLKCWNKSFEIEILKKKNFKKEIKRNCTKNWPSWIYVT